MIRPQAIAAIVALALAPAAEVAAQPTRSAMDEEARTEFERGLEAFRAGDYAAAIEALRRGYAIEPHPDLLFALAQAERLAGDCAAALPHYRTVLATELSDEDARDVERLIALCERTLADADARPPPVASGPAAGGAGGPTIVAPAEARDPAPSPWYRDPWGGALLAGGVLGAGVGAGFLVSAARQDTLAGDADTLDGAVDHWALADERRRTGAIVLGVGGALIAGSLVRYLIAGDDRDPTPLAVTVAASGAGGLGLALGARF